MTQTDYYGTTRRRGRYGLLLIAFVAFVLGVGATILAVRNWDRLAGLIRPAAKVAAIVPAPAQPVVRPMPPPSDPALDERLAAIESRVNMLDARAAEASGDADRAEALLIAFAARRALDRGQPLGYIEGLLRDRFGSSDAPSVVQIIAAAQRPVTLAQLRDGLEALRPTLVTRGSDQAWWPGFKHELSSLFVVRRADQPSTVPADRLTRAEHALEEGQVDAAAAEVARMPGAARANDWLAQARRYVLARNALDRIESAALLKPKASPAVVPAAIVD
ncbi:COG4223 family protein [Sphingomonas crusticola]|uniref:COG4223 family protein n=1 Tax=Sphingomonas crusticola TaxID=1697973 RepID=UPI000E27A9DB|nr:mitofilin family membrane protein [Sphingomonas crusticola]